MSNSIDKRIVEMQFDNKQFESGVQTSIKTLSQLKQNLNFDKAAKGLESLEKAGRSFTLSYMNDSINAISHRFSAMGIVGMTVLQNITNSAYNCAKKMVSILTIDPLKMGFAEYETQINAVQTILSNTSSEMDKLGYDQQTRLDVVNAKLDELNTYADKTIYNFTEMTRNIGTFTAAGVDLDTSVSAIKGIANLAAASGSTSTQASTAMYQLSQAIATGTIRLMDWNSVVNAGMGGELFQNALIRTASVMGVVGEDAQEMFQKLKSGDVSFRDSLSSGWLSSDILTTTLSQMALDFESIAEANNITVEAAKELAKTDLLTQGYTIGQAEEIIALAETATDAATKVKTLTQLFDTMKEAMQSGWTQSWEYIIGDFGEAKEFLTNISNYFGNIIEASAESRNSILSDWNALGGRNKLIEGFWNIIYSIENITKTVKDAFSEFFPSTTGQQLFNITQKISDFTAKIKEATENSELMEKVSRVFKGVAAAFNIVTTSAGWAWNGLKKLIGISKGASGGFLDFLAGIGDSVVGFRDTIKSSETLQNILSKLGNAAASVRDLIVGGIKQIGTFFGNLWLQIQGSGIFVDISDFVEKILARIPEFITRISEWGKSIVTWVKNCDLLKKAWNSIKGFFEAMIIGIANFGKALWNSIQAFFSDGIHEDGLLDRLKAGFIGFAEKIGEWFETIKPNIIQGWENAKTFLITLFTKTIPKFFENLKIDAIQKWPWLERIFAFFEEAWTKVYETTAPILNKIKKFGAQLWIAIGNLFGGKNESNENTMTFGESIQKILNENWNGIKEIFSEFFLTTIPQWFEQFEGIDWGKIIKAAFGVFTGIKLFQAISGIGKLGSGLSSIGKGLVGTGGLLQNLSKNLKNLIGPDGLKLEQISKKSDSFGTSLLKIAGSIAIIVGAIVVLSNMDSEKAWKSIGMLSLIAGELLVVTALFKKIDANGDSLLRAAGAIALMLVPIYLLGNMNIGTAIKGMVGIGIILTELAVFTKIAGSGMIGKQSFVGLAIAVNLLVLAVRMLGEMNVGTALQGIIVLGVMMLELNLLMKNTGAVKTTGVISMALAINLMVKAVRDIGGLNSRTILKGMIGLAGITAAFSVLIQITKNLKFINSISALLLVAGSMALVVAVFKQIENANMDDILKFAVSFGATMISLSAAMKIISMIPISGALTGLGSFAILILGIGGIVAALGWLQNDVIDLVGFIGSGGNVLQQLGIAIGKFIGGIGSGIVTGVDLPTVGTQLSDFYTNAEPFLTGMANLDVPDYNFFEMIFGVTRYKTFANDIKHFATGLKAYATEIGGFSATISEIDSDNAIAVATSLSAFAKTVPENTVLEHLLGISDLSTFSAAIPGFAAGMKAYATEIGGFSSTISETDSNNAIAVAESLSEFVKVLPENTFWENLFGISDFGTFSSDIENFGKGIKAYAIAVKGFGELLSADDVTDLSATMISIGGMIRDLGDNADAYTDLWTISGSLGEFGTKYAYFVQKLNDSGVSEHQESALTLIKDIAGIIVSLANIKSVYDISDYIKWIADDLSTFATKTENLDPDAAVKLGDFIRNITESAVLSNTIGDTSLASVQELLNSFSALTIPEFTLEGEESALAYISSLVFGIQKGTIDLSNAVVMGSDQAILDVRNTYSSWVSAGLYLGLGLRSGIASSTPYIRTSATNAALSAVYAVRSTWDEHSPSKVGIDLGRFFDLGLSGGIDQYGYMVSRSATEVSSDVIKSAQSVLNGLDYVGNDVDFNYTIRPVMDLTDVLNGMNDIDGLFSGSRTISSGYFGGLTGIQSARAFSNEQIRTSVSMDNGNIVGELVTLEHKFDELNAAIRNMKLMLDTGTIVGEITESVDTNLGVLAGRRVRGN